MNIIKRKSKSVPNFMTPLLVLLCLLECRLMSAEEPNVAQPEEEEEEQSDYLYDTDDATPIQEYIPEEGQSDADHPDFLFGPGNPARLIEFYAPWCPHCQYFRDHYIQFARQVDLVTEEMGLPPIEFHAISCTANRNLCRKFGIDGYPRLHLFRQGATNTTEEAKYWELHPFAILNSLGIHVDNMRLDVDLTRLDAKQKRQVQRTVNEEFHRSKQDTFNDAHLSFDFNLRNGIFISDEPMSNNTKTALRDWLELLKKSLPPAWQVQTVVNALLENFETVTGGDEQLVEVLDKLPGPPKKQWSKSCTKGKPGMGYTCGLWELFHIVTVGAVEWNMMLQSDQTDMAISTSHVADTLRNFIANFFGCEVCRINFLSSYDACSFDRCNRLTDDYAGLSTWQQLPLWLFETHNAVNVRLTKEQAERDNAVPTHQDEVAKHWPARIECPKCWLDDSSWDEDAIYKFLRIEYWPEDFVTDRYRGEVVEIDADGIFDDQKITSTMFLWIFIVALATGAGVAWHSRKARIKRSGHHKKFDSYV